VEHLRARRHDEWTRDMSREEDKMLDEFASHLTPGGRE
jgi:flagellar biosynthesis chaperone FliJ